MTSEEVEKEIVFTLLNQTLSLAEFLSVNIFVGVEMPSDRRYWCTNGKKLQFDFMSNELTFREADLWIKPGKLVGENAFTKDDCAQFFDNADLPMWKKHPVHRDEEKDLDVTKVISKIELQEEKEAENVVSTNSFSDLMKYDEPDLSGNDNDNILDDESLEDIPIENRTAHPTSELINDHFSSPVPQETDDQEDEPLLDNGLQCSQCEKTFENEEEKDAHAMTCNICVTCQKSFVSMDDLKNHVISSEDCGSECNMCGRRFLNHVFMRIHRHQHPARSRKPNKSEPAKQKLMKNRTENTRATKKQGITCRQCGLQLPNIQTYNEHCKLCKVCFTCKTEFPTKQLLLEHVQEQDGKCGLECEHCGTKFYNRIPWQKHRITCKEAKLKCYKCGMLFTDKRKMTHHVSFCKECPTCQKVFKSMLELRKHIKDSNTCGAKCDVCGINFVSGIKLKIHMVNCHMGQARQRSKSKKACPICHETFHDWKAIRAHQKHKCGFKCEICGEIKPNMQVLNIHRREQHLTNYMCELCGTVFRTRYGLEQHKDRATCTRSCEICGKRVLQLKTHMRIHKQGGALSAR